MYSTQEVLEAVEKAIQQMKVEEAKASEEKSHEGSRLSRERTGGVKKYDKEYFISLSQKYLDFTYKNPTTPHVIQYFANELDKAGFTYLSERNTWDDFVPGKYYTIRSGTSLVAFSVGDNWEAENGLSIIGAHADSLTAKLKPISLRQPAEGFELLGVAPYAGTLNQVWFDRDLGIGGKVIVKRSGSNKIEACLIDSTPHPVARIPTLAPHFGKPSVGPFDRENQAVPVIGAVSEGEEEDDEDHDEEDEKRSPLYGKHSVHLLRYIARLAKVKVSELYQLDLELFDVQEGTFGGLRNEFIYAPRLDDRLCCFSAIESLISSSQQTASNSFDVVALFDNEEVGSFTRQGALSGILESTVKRVIATKSKHSNALELAFANSIIISADVTHMVNPNFAVEYLEHHKPKPNIGLTVCISTNAHMATDPVGLCFVEELARRNNDRLQYFQNKNGSQSGSTIGPYIAGSTGVRTIDMGIAQLSMHSIRAATGSKDIGLAVKFFEGFFANRQQTLAQFGDL
ncbi:HBL034Cp [Eremothecium sinecaudum]|uniref:HBL034Cp n=1 Tax=Eremothecium sinecaudum TaxID=45286 RepID=A0A109UWJ7_9SACH|nr:HBL034Cp [Eremothecium sinecaudum]AMD18868.1 HBL034Cp [Eremothecium sinecaudum]